MQDISKQDNLVWIQMALSNLDFCYCTAGNVTAIQLQLCGYPFLRHAGFFPQLADVMTNPLFHLLVDIRHLLTKIAPIWVRFFLTLLYAGDRLDFCNCRSGNADAI
jgi:hypothetical protein